MVKIKFYGNLKQFGSEFCLEVKNTAEAIRALCSQIPTLRQKLQQGYYKIRIGREYLDPEALERGLFYRLKKGQTIHFTPVIQGAKGGGIFQAVLGVALIGIAMFAPLDLIGGMAGSNLIGSIGIAMTLGGVAQMLTRTPSVSSGTGNETEKESSTAFSNLSNLVAQGKPVPLAYGLIRTGSLVISQGVETVTIKENKPANRKKSIFSKKG